MAATTAADVRASFARTVFAAERAGLDPSRWALIEGSATYGRAWRLVERDPVTGGHSTALGLGDHLGSSRREAVAALDGMRAALLTVSDLRRVG